MEEEQGEAPDEIQVGEGIEGESPRQARRGVPEAVCHPTVGEFVDGDGQEHRGNCDAVFTNLRSNEAENWNSPFPPEKLGKR
jgi:hypothetical protein